MDSKIEKSDDCNQQLLAAQSDPRPNRTIALDANNFKLLTWNVLKEKKEGWAKDFGRLGNEIDLFIIQEAYLTDGLKGVLRNERLNWIFAPAFVYRGVHTGVLTASKTPSIPVCMERFSEPIIRLPKSVLITRHPLSVPGRSLLVVNVHSINFALGVTSFRNYWKQLEDIMLAAEGPVILSGDFNTWTEGRLAVVRDSTRRLSLKPVIFPDDRRSTIFGNVVDHVYYRGLIPIDTEIYEVTTSDHNPMVVRFRLDVKNPAPAAPLE